MLQLEDVPVVQSLPSFESFPSGTQPAHVAMPHGGPFAGSPTDASDALFAEWVLYEHESGSIVKVEEKRLLVVITSDAIEAWYAPDEYDKTSFYGNTESGDSFTTDRGNNNMLMGNSNINKKNTALVPFSHTRGGEMSAQEFGHHSLIGGGSTPQSSDLQPVERIPLSFFMLFGIDEVEDPHCVTLAGAADRLSLRCADRDQTRVLLDALHQSEIRIARSTATQTDKQKEESIPMIQERQRAQSKLERQVATLEQALAAAQCELAEHRENAAAQQRAATEAAFAFVEVRKKEQQVTSMAHDNLLLQELKGRYEVELMASTMYQRAFRTLQHSTVKELRQATASEALMVEEKLMYANEKIRDLKVFVEQQTVTIENSKQELLAAERQAAEQEKKIEAQNTAAAKKQEEAQEAAVAPLRLQIQSLVRQNDAAVADLKKARVETQAAISRRFDAEKRLTDDIAMVERDLRQEKSLRQRAEADMQALMDTKRNVEIKLKGCQELPRRFVRMLPSPIEWAKVGQCCKRAAAATEHIRGAEGLSWEFRRFVPLMDKLLDFYDEVQLLLEGDNTPLGGTRKSSPARSMSALSTHRPASPQFATPPRPTTPTVRVPSKPIIHDEFPRRSSPLPRLSSPARRARPVISPSRDRGPVMPGGSQYARLRNSQVAWK